MKKIIIILIVAAMILALASCKKQESNAVTVVLDWTPNTNHTGLYVALEKGWFREAGLTVEILQPPEDGALALVGAGKAEFGVDFQESLGMALASDSPPPVVAVAAILQHNTSGIVSLAQNNITSPKSLENMRFSSWGSPFAEAVIKSVVESDGGDYSKVKIIPDMATDVVSALQATMDAVWIYEGWDGVAVRLAGLDTNYFAFRDIDPVFDFYTPVLVANSDTAANNPAMVKSFLSAAAKGYEFAAQNPEEAAEILLKHAPEIGRQLALESQKFVSAQYIDAAARWGAFDPARWSAFYGWMFEQGLLPRDIRNEGFTNDYLPG